MTKAQVCSLAARYLAPVTGLVLLILAIAVVRHQLRDYQVEDIVASLRSLPPQQVIQAIALASLGYLAMTGYDALGFIYTRQRLAYQKVALTTFISSALSNSIGFALLTGSAVRYRFYTNWGIPALAIAQIIAFASISFWLGLLALGGVAFVAAPFQIPAQLNLPFESTAGLGYVLLALTMLYLVVCGTVRSQLTFRHQPLRLPRPRIALAQLVVSCLDWSFAAATLYCLLPQTPELTYLAFLKIYLLAMAAGVLSNVPGGLGVFETVVILLLSAQFSPAAVLASLLAYRGVYYFLPLAIALISLATYELRQKNRPLRRLKLERPDDED